MSSHSKLLLICTVGGSPAPIVTSLTKHNPDYVIFIASEASMPQIVDGYYVLQDPVPNSGNPKYTGRLVAENTAKVVLVDHENPEACIKAIREQCLHVVKDWRNGRGKVVVDFTGGTKCMSVALGLAARMWPCHLSYVTAARRDKRGLGQATESGPVVSVFNPWKTLGYEALDQFCVLFSQGYFGAARTIIDNYIKAPSKTGEQPIFDALSLLAHAYERWEAFDHTIARNELIAAIAGLPTGISEGLQRNLADNKAWLDRLCDGGTGPTVERAADLIANARRRGREKRFEDGVARLYRACEVIVQCWFKNKWQVADIRKFPESKMPSSLRTGFERLKEKTTYHLTMRDAYKLLNGMKARLGGIFFSHERGGRGPFTARNKSILAHGFTPATEQTFGRCDKFIDELFIELCRPEGQLNAPNFPNVKAVDFDAARAIA